MELASILDWHLLHYPLLRAEDIYKLIYQGVFGPGHPGADREGVAEGVRAELARLRRCFPVEPFEPVDPEGLLVRLNLRAVAGSRVKEQMLVEAVLTTIREFVPGPDRLLPRLEQARAWCEEHLPAEADRLSRLIEEMPEPPVHSGLYRRVYQPAYRLILARLSPRFGQSGSSGQS
ncbi:MAG: hypothetical protein N2248_00095 [candidate division WOR-3 bacterium]|uniref:Uncharacterized protein n=1 Tax=candidate division WOR-3 bacterium TaxID=2052148 RepID=A0A7C3J1C1_UNCW3|nr:hypothetical protein [candidate division WOR-3 bacterium]